MRFFYQKNKNGNYQCLGCRKDINLRKKKKTKVDNNHTCQENACINQYL